MFLKTNLLAKFKSTATNLKSPNFLTIHIPVYHTNAVSFAVDLLANGNVIAVPTDTVYGLACSATNLDAIRKLYCIKTRDRNKPLAICFSKVDDVKQWATVDYLPDNLLSALLPGPVTIILRCTNNLNPSLTAFGKIGVRIPDYPFIRSIINAYNCPVALTSANKSGEPNSISIENFKPLWNKVSAVFDGGKLGTDTLSCAASTVVDLSDPGLYRIIRRGNAENKIEYILRMYGLTLNSKK